MKSNSNRSLQAPSKKELCLYRAPQNVWGWQLFKKNSRVIPRTYRADNKVVTVFDSTDARMARARANDNGGNWWAARSYYDVETLEEMFLWSKGGVASVLYERVGGLLGNPELHGFGFIYIQVRFEDNLHDARLVGDCLTRIRVVLEHRVEHLELIKTA